MDMICEKELCTGCGVCSNICPTASIMMREDEYGFIHPVINQSKCIDCGLCKSKCPINNIQKDSKEPIDYIAAWNKDSSIREKSTSGGVFSEIAYSIIKKGGVVYGVSWNEDLLPEFKCAKTLEDVEWFRGSKYAQAFTNDVYKRVKEHLESDLYVLFSGTPCQVSGLYSYLGKEYEKLFTIDIVCHGVPSATLLQSYVRSLEKNNKATNISLRFKNPYWDYSNVRIAFSDGSVYLTPTTDDPYFILFNVGYSLRDSCHTCKYAKLSRVGDITLSDFWNYSPPNFKMSGFDKGVSLIMINSEKGSELFNLLASSLVYEKATKSMALKTNQTLKKPFAPPQDKVEEFWKDYRNGSSWSDLQRKYVPNPLKIPSLLWLRRVVRRYRWLIKK